MKVLELNKREYVLLAIVDKSKKIWKLLSSTNYIDLEKLQNIYCLLKGG
jgi:hypothetical protein